MLELMHMAGPGVILLAGAGLLGVLLNLLTPPQKSHQVTQVMANSTETYTPEHQRSILAQSTSWLGI